MGDPSFPPCVQCGACCKRVPCGFGNLNPETGWCSSLQETAVVGGCQLYGCGQFDVISQDPSSHISPAFGAGCCMTLFNTARAEIRQALASAKSGAC